MYMYICEELIFKKHQEKKGTEGERERKRKAEESADLPEGQSDQSLADVL